MPFDWFKTREAATVGAALAEYLLLPPTAAPRRARARANELQRQQLSDLLHEFLQKVDREARPLRLNTYKRASLANSFRWKLLEKGVEPEIVAEFTRALVVHLTPGGAPVKHAIVTPPARRAPNADPETLLASGEACVARGAWAQAVEVYQELLSRDPRHAVARNNLGAALSKLGRYAEAEEQFRRAIAARAKFPDAHVNLGAVLQWTGRIAESEMPLRRALRWRPSHLDAQINLGVTLELLGRLPDATDVYEKLLKIAPGNSRALVGVGRIAALEGRFEEAEKLLQRALDADRSNPMAWAALVGLRRAVWSDDTWLKGALEVAAAGLAPVEEVHIRFALGKYYDDIADFARAFRNYRRGNELQRGLAPPYDREGRTRCVDELIAVYTRERLMQAHPGSSDSTRPVLVAGMMRSGTSLVEQIIASHPVASGAGELDFWHMAARRHEAVLRHGPPEESLRKKLAASYLQALSARSADAQRVVDKANVNCDYLGLIHSVFPHARMIYVLRDPVDTCLSCYFQHFSAALNFAWDLSDLAHYYREHRRLVDHWRRALPPGVLLEVPYEELVADQQGWTHRILDFLELEWDQRCINFDQTRRTVLTASYWQVRQKMYKSSVGRWRHYRKFIGPLLSLRD
jgi:tetratricopeptide (TPR) repeat protein